MAQEYLDSINDVELMDLDGRLVHTNASGARVFNYRKMAILIFALLLSSFHLYTAFFGTFEGLLQRMLHASFALPLFFLVFPIKKDKKDPRPQPKVWLAYDMLMIFLSLVSVGYFLFQYPRLSTRFFMASPVFFLDIFFGCILIYCIFAAARRSVGIAIPILAVLFSAYALFGKNMPGILFHQGLTFPRYIDVMCLYVEGIWGDAIAVIATYVILYIVFGAFLEMTGAGAFFINLAYSITGRSCGGPAKAAVISSAMMGTISGSAVANVVTTGTFTIPLMKKTGYKPQFAAAVEATASSGGQIMPPVMGAGAFLIAEFTGTPYATVMLVAIIPALLYFSNVFINVHLEAKKLGLTGMPSEQIPKARGILKDGWYHLLPLIVLIAFLVMRYSAMRACIMAIITTTATWIISSLIKKIRSKDESWKEMLSIMFSQLVKTLERGAINALPVIGACLAAGVIIGCISMTGLAIKFSALLISFAGGQVWLAILMITFASIVLGMGLPTTAAYILLAVLAAPALNGMGVPLLTAHFIVFWLSQSSHVTPPVCVATYAAAAIAEANPIKSAFIAMRLGICIYTAPYIFAETPILLQGSFLEVAYQTIIALVALTAISAGFEGFFINRLNMIRRIIVGLGGLCMLIPELITDVIGITVFLVFIVTEIIIKKRPPVSAV